MRQHKRSIYGCTQAPFTPPTDCRYTYNPETNRLYLHVFAWPLKYLHLPGLRNRVRYAQLLNDGSEVKTFDFTQHHRYPSEGQDTLTLELPIRQPDVYTPVVELFPNWIDKLFTLEDRYPGKQGKVGSLPLLRALYQGGSAWKLGTHTGTGLVAVHSCSLQCYRQEMLGLAACGTVTTAPGCTAGTSCRGGGAGQDRRSAQRDGAGHDPVLHSAQ